MSPESPPGRGATLERTTDATGADALVATAVDAGLRVCFANPGTTELTLVAALDRVPGMRSVLCLFEGVCSAAADGYARMSGVPAMTLLHLGPGFANGIANFHNARRARTPLLNVIGDQARWHRQYDPPLTSDVVSLAQPVSGWLRESTDSRALAADAADAIRAARSGCVATLIAPSDVQSGPGGAASASETVERRGPEPGAVERAARRLADGANAIFLGDSGLSERGLTAAGRIAAHTGCRLICDTFPARLERGGNLPEVERLPYFPEPALEALHGLDGAVLAGTRAPVAFFGYPGLPSEFLAESTNREVLTEPGDDVSAALEALADTLGAKPATSARESQRPDRPRGDLTPESVAAAVAALQTENAIVVDEGLTAGLPYFAASQRAPRHSYLALTGGAIGQGLPSATGAALACPERPVIALQADGSAMYTLQALWTQAREALDITNIILANGGYHILELELERAGQSLGEQATAMTAFDPLPDWVALSRGFGVPAVRVANAEQLCRELQRALEESGPHLIEVRL